MKLKTKCFRLFPDTKAGETLLVKMLTSTPTFAKLTKQQEKNTMSAATLEISSSIKTAKSSTDMCMNLSTLRFE